MHWNGVYYKKHHEIKIFPLWGSMLSMTLKSYAFPENMEESKRIVLCKGLEMFPQLKLSKMDTFNCWVGWLVVYSYWVPAKSKNVIFVNTLHFYHIAMFLFPLHKYYFCWNLPWYYLTMIQQPHHFHQN